LAFYACCLCSALLLRDLWSRLSDKSVGGLCLLAELVVQTATVTVVPIAIYIGLFYVHLTILTKAGVHDALMTSAFQVIFQNDFNLLSNSSYVTMTLSIQILIPLIKCFLADSWATVGMFDSILFDNSKLIMFDDWNVSFLRKKKSMVG
jgi:hypothetical protein